MDARGQPLSYPNMADSLSEALHRTPAAQRARPVDRYAYTLPAALDTSVYPDGSSVFGGGEADETALIAVPPRVTPPGYNEVGASPVLKSRKSAQSGISELPCDSSMAADDASNGGVSPHGERLGTMASSPQWRSTHNRQARDIPLQQLVLSPSLVQPGRQHTSYDDLWHSPAKNEQRLRELDDSLASIASSEYQSIERQHGESFEELYRQHDDYLLAVRCQEEQCRLKRQQELEAYDHQWQEKATADLKALQEEFARKATLERAQLQESRDMYAAAQARRAARLRELKDLIGNIAKNEETLRDIQSSEDYQLVLKFSPRAKEQLEGLIERVLTRASKVKNIGEVELTCHFDGFKRSFQQILKAGQDAVEDIRANLTRCAAQIAAVRQKAAEEQAKELAREQAREEEAKRLAASAQASSSNVPPVGPQATTSTDTRAVDAATKMLSADKTVKPMARGRETYRRHEELVAQVKSQIGPLENDPNAQQLQHIITRSFNQLAPEASSVQQHLGTILQAVRQLYQSQGPPQNETYLLFCINEICEQVAVTGPSCQGDENLGNPAFHVGQLACEILNHASTAQGRAWALMGDLLVAHMSTRCPLVVPCYPPAQEWLKFIGKKDRKAFLKEIGSYLRLYGAILQSAKSPFGAGSAWVWLTRLINQNPQTGISATALAGFLKMNASILQQTYKSVFTRLLLTVRDQYIPKLEAGLAKAKTPQTVDEAHVNVLKDIVQSALEQKLGAPAGRLKGF